MTEILEDVSYETIYQRLAKIQAEMNVPKNLYNEHGKFYYRNAESILLEAKTVCSKYHCLLRMEDSVETIGDRFYVVATAILTSLYPEEEQGEIRVKGYAREPIEQKGMSAAMITGASSSYARKYALNGLFCIDDGQDVDSQDAQLPSGEEFAVQYTKVLNQLAKYEFDPRSNKVIEWVKSKTGAESLDVGKLMLNVEEGMKVLNLLEQVLEIKEEGK